MNASLTTYLASELAALPSVPAPVLGQLGYGRDLSCVSDCSDDFAEIDGSTPLIIMQALARRFQTPRGKLLSDSDYGLDLRGKVNRGTTVSDLRALQTQAIGECMKDDRVERVTLELSYAADTLSMRALVTPRDPRLEPFPMVLAITDLVVLSG